ncbi:Uncharacterised protein [Acholeplasma hippikon]|uniref:Uncharacterized protein n=2 Tax=Acholeplasma hippikon TaxID=264636 RepID=A0A449BKV4_9MOLU|nr:Uncharacterised protein [Acholeplasma hippikon]
MARANKNEVSKKEVKEKKVSGVLTGVKEESPKGELFFKIVLYIMAAGLLAITLYFVIDTIFNKSDKGFEPTYHANNYVNVSHVRQIVDGENFENIEHVGIRYALDHYKYVYVLFIADYDQSSIDEKALDRQTEALNVVNELFGLSVKKELAVTNPDVEDYTIVTLGDEVAIFFVDVTLSDNAAYRSVVDTGEGQAASASLPVMLEVTDGIDLNWFGPWTAIDKNPSSVTKLNSVLESLK